MFRTFILLYTVDMETLCVSELLSDTQRALVLLSARLGRHASRKNTFSLYILVCPLYELRP